jgi:DNA-binding PadR family transcriptional regulator
LALAVLCCLLERPMHPYEVATTLRQRNKEHSVKRNYGALYAVVESLRKRGLIEPKETERPGRLPERTVYQLTDAGREALGQGPAPAHGDERPWGRLQLRLRPAGQPGRAARGPAIDGDGARLRTRLGPGLDRIPVHLHRAPRSPVVGNRHRVHRQAGTSPRPDDDSHGAKRAHHGKRLHVQRVRSTGAGHRTARRPGSVYRRCALGILLLSGRQHAASH